MKVCPHCRDRGNPEPQPLSAFNTRNGKPRSWCRKCESEYQREYLRRPEVRVRNAVYSQQYETTENGRAARQRVIAKRKADGREYLRGRRKQLKSQFDLTVEQYEVMLESQGGRCAICRELPLRRFALAVDHDHATGRIRGLLCSKCNIGLGKFYERIERLFASLSYLRKHEQSVKAA